MDRMQTTPITAAAVRSALLARIDAYQKATGKSDSAIGKDMLNDDRFVKRIRAGGGFTLATFQKATEWLDAHSADVEKVA